MAVARYRRHATETALPKFNGA